MANDTLALRISRCESICNQLKSEMSDVMQQAYDLAVAAQDEETAALAARSIRNKLLSDSDSEMVEDRPSDKEAWATYRQALRDLTEQAGFPFEIEWPQAPND